VVHPPSERARPAISGLPTASASGPPFDRDDPPDGDAAEMPRASQCHEAVHAVGEEIWLPSFVASGLPVPAAEGAVVPTGKKEIPL
jgi:hypothetical protein